jgi:hypothetical protein
MPSFNSLKQAIQAAEADVNSAVSDPKKAADITGKVISFYSKIWNFLSNDLIALSRLPAMRDFFDDQKNPDQNSNLNASPNIKDVRTQLITALKSDDSPWFKQIRESLDGVHGASIPIRLKRGVLAAFHLGFLHKVTEVAFIYREERSHFFLVFDL